MSKQIAQSLDAIKDTACTIKGRHSDFWESIKKVNEKTIEFTTSRFLGYEYNDYNEKIPKPETEVICNRIEKKLLETYSNIQVNQSVCEGDSICIEVNLE